MKDRQNRVRKWYARVVLLVSVLGLFGVAGSAVAAVLAWNYFSKGLPDHTFLVNYEPPVASRAYFGDGSLLAQYATENRVFVPINAIPQIVQQAFIAAEDQHFHTHMGIDLLGIARAAIANIGALVDGRRMQGASTITQQVAKNFLLSNEVSYQRKIREAILAFRIEEALSKDRILELYLNEIYLGYGSYGVASAAINYFDSALDELTIAQAAYLAALPKAPNNYHPIRKSKAAFGRRNWVVDRLREEGYITQEQAYRARNAALEVADRQQNELPPARYAVEEIRREVSHRYGPSRVYEGGLYIRSSLDPHMQAAAERALLFGLSQYDMRHGWRGPVDRIELNADWAVQLSEIEHPVATGDWRLAVVRGMSERAAVVGFANREIGLILLEDLTWARRNLGGNRRGRSITQPADVLEIGDVVLVEEVPESGDVKRFALRQVPQVSGSLVAMNPHNGRIYAMQGGLSYGESEFNRVTQAWRQPGSALKPIVYMAALDHGYTPATLIEDAPFVYDPGPGQEQWRPANYYEKFYGPTPLRIGIEKSRNLMTVRLANDLGGPVVSDYFRKFSVIRDDEPFYLSSALGAVETTLMKLTTSYSMIVNGGKRISPGIVDRIQDRYGSTVWRRDTRSCPQCNGDEWVSQSEPPRLPDRRDDVVDPVTAYQMVHMLEGVVERGTGVGLRDLSRPLAGKTGTTNDNRDAWFIGFSPDLAVGVYVGHDNPRSLGDRETGSSVALPVWKAFMKEALSDKPVIPFRVPAGVRLVRIDGDRGLLPGAVTSRIIREAFRPGTEPTRYANSSSVAQGDVSQEDRHGLGSVY